MRFATILHNKETLPALVSKDGLMVMPLSKEFPSSLLSCIEQGSSFLDKATSFVQSEEKPWIPLEEVELLAPIPRPSKNIFCIGKNYKEHAIEMGSAEDIPEDIIVFTKPPTAVIGPGAEIPSHSDLTEQLDYEGELAIIIGKKGGAFQKKKQWIMYLGIQS